MDYLQERSLKFAPDLHYKMWMRDMKTFREALWHSYDYTIDSPLGHIAGHRIPCAAGTKIVGAF